MSKRPLIDPAKGVRPRSGLRQSQHIIRFWIVLALESVGQRRFGRVARHRLDKTVSRDIRGADHVPDDGNFVMALNHYNGIPTLDVLAEAINIIAETRPDLVDRCYLIVGSRRRPTTHHSSPSVRLARRLVDWFYSRWSENALRISGTGGGPSIQQLREWKARSARQPVLVFPEGKAQLCFGQVRKGSGRWLAAIGVPVIPVAIWHTNAKRSIWVGSPIRWSHRSELHDIQLGLSMAALLPPELAPAWQETLDSWHRAHGRAQATVAVN